MPSLLPNELILLMRLFDLVSAVAGADCEAPGGGGPGGRLCGCGGCGGGCPSGGGGPGGGGGRVPGSTTLTEPAFMIIAVSFIISCKKNGGKPWRFWRRRASTAVT